MSEVNQQKIFSQFHSKTEHLDGVILTDSLVVLVMIFDSSYVLLLAEQAEELFGLASLLEKLRFTVEIAHSAEQAIAKVSHTAPCLMILQGNRWSSTFVQELRTLANSQRMMLVVLTDCHAPSWLHQDQNPGFDGYLVKPLSSDVLSSLVQSASVRQQCLTN